MKSAFLASFLFALVFILINLRYLSKSVDWDPATYAHNVESGTLREVFFNAHHVAHESSGLAWMKALRLIWADAPLYFGLRLRMLLWSAVFIMVIALYIARLYGDRAGGLLIAASVAFSEAFWFNAQENETALPHIFFQTLLYFLCIPGMRAGFSWKRLTVCGLAQVASIAFHQADALYIFTV
ncbi:MAG: hypothetical protein HY042_06545, partial [Spirochaetia bacterium]|nr:hypothetical protein [Spirochaetia bacterium]